MSAASSGRAPRVLIDGYFIDRAYGFGRYVRELVHALDREPVLDVVIAVTPRGESVARRLVTRARVVTARERFFPIWEQVTLPLLARLYSLYYKMDTLLDTATLLPQQMSLYSEEGRRQRLGTTRFDRTSRRAFFEISSGGSSFKNNINIPPQVQDGLSALYAVRASSFGPNTRLTYPIIDDGAIYTVTMQAAGTERVRVPAGDLNTWKLGVSIVDAQGQTIGQNVGIWLTKDARKMPVKLQADLPVGSFTLALREASN